MAHTYLHVELSFAAGVVHISNLAEHLAFLPPHVVDAHHRPGAARETVRVSPVQLVLVVEKDAPVERTGSEGEEEEKRIDNRAQGL